MLEKIDAVDCVQRHAGLWGVVDEIGQDEVQRLMSEYFAPPPEVPSDYAARLIRDWEMADERDRHRWTGELPPVQQVVVAQKLPHRPAQSTVDAFRYVMRVGDPERLTAWLRNHPDDAPALLEMLEAA
ncbi:hypothetical protein E4K64_16485 [Bradyrhizobium frederickii]|uniref:Uncharacterized protein n=1 Tax=Bradyrhizobium frederickii TaxID=2560054 RepID=A0A4Y9P4P7_9BRAD|nr:hypothetical protein E4K64_16485 [Bradyrhizobium frederickii]